MRTGKKPELGFWHREKRLAVQIGSGESLMLRVGSFSWKVGTDISSSIMSQLHRSLNRTTAPRAVKPSKRSHWEL
jgi:hypothetical protein